MLEFEFNGHKSSEYGVIISKVEENDSLLTRTPILGQKNKYHARENHFGTNYDDNYSFNITLIKNPCNILCANISNESKKIINGKSTENKNLLTFNNGELLPSITIEDNDQLLDFPDEYSKDIDHNIFSLNGSEYFTSDDISKINAWLTSPQLPILFKFINAEYLKEDIEYFVTVTASETENIGRPYSLTFTFTCDSPYGYTPEIKQVFNVKGNKYSQTFFNNTNCRNEYVYPIIYVEPLDNGQLTITNKTDNDKSLVLSNLQIGKSFYMDCNKFKIYTENVNGDKTSVSFDKLGLTPSTIYWPRLCYGDNTFEFSGVATLTFIYREPRKAGVFV